MGVPPPPSHYLLFISLSILLPTLIGLLLYLSFFGFNVYAAFANAPGTMGYILLVVSYICIIHRKIDSTFSFFNFFGERVSQVAGGMIRPAEQAGFAAACARQCLSCHPPLSQ